MGVDGSEIPPKKRAGKTNTNSFSCSSTIGAPITALPTFTCELQSAFILNITEKRWAWLWAIPNIFAAQ